jgi:plasmid maintenance system antidote protein VapI
MPLTTRDQNILRLIDILLEKGKINSKGEFYEVLGMSRQNISDVRHELRGFTPEQIDIIVYKYGVRPDFIWGVTKKVFYRGVPNVKQLSVFPE